jgi:PAS domain S-box-containing protein
VSNRWLNAMVAALVVEVGLAVIVRSEQAGRFFHGEHDAESVAGLVGLGWLVVLLLTAGGVGRSIYAGRRELFRRDQAIAADESTSRDWQWESDVEHRFTYCGPGVRHLLGYDPQELIGRSTYELMAPDQVDTARQLVEAARGEQSGWDPVTFTWMHADGTAVLLEGAAAPMRNERGVLIGFRGTRRHVTAGATSDRELATARQRVTAMLREAALDIALQPIVDLTTGELAGAEALSRFRDGRGPDAWFREARMTGLDLELDRLAFAAALATLHELPPGSYLSINASPQLITDRCVQSDLLTGELPLERLVIEVTEHVQIADYGDLHAALGPLRDCGVRLAIDDTGAGYASLSHVLQLRPDVIKIDRSLITNISEDPARRSLITALVLLALDLGATVTGEGVETSAELETLQNLGVDQAQGYLLSRPTTESAQWTAWSEQNWLARGTLERSLIAG